MANNILKDCSYTIGLDLSNALINSITTGNWPVVVDRGRIGDFWDQNQDGVVNLSKKSPRGKEILHRFNDQRPN